MLIRCSFIRFVSQERDSSKVARPLRAMPERKKYIAIYGCRFVLLHFNLLTCCGLLVNQYPEIFRTFQLNDELLIPERLHWILNLLGFGLSEVVAVGINLNDDEEVSWPGQTLWWKKGRKKTSVRYGMAWTVTKKCEHSNIVFSIQNVTLAQSYRKRKQKNDKTLFMASTIHRRTNEWRFKYDINQLWNLGQSWASFCSIFLRSYEVTRIYLFKQSSYKIKFGMPQSPVRAEPLKVEVVQLLTCLPFIPLLGKKLKGINSLPV